MTIVGFHASHEQLPPSRLLDAVKHAEQAGFDAAMCSDHFEPWSVRQGHSGYAWSWLAAALEATQFSLGVVTAPGQRYHPAIQAQKIATLAEMYPRRFWAAIGSGEAINEHVTGDPWPEKEERDARLVETIDVMRRLLRGRGGLGRRAHPRRPRRASGASPRSPPPLFAAAVSTETAREAAEWADGVITVDQPRDALREFMDAYRDAGGRGPDRRAGAPQLGADRRGGARDRARPVAPEPRARAPRVGARLPRGVRRAHGGRHARAGRRDPRRLGRPAPVTSTTSPASPSSASTASTCTTSAPSSTASSTPSASACCPPCGAPADEDHRPQRPLVEDRRRLLPRRRDLHGLERRRLGRLRGPRAPARPPRRTRRHGDLAHALPAHARPRRRLRHHRLHGGRSSARRAHRRRRVHPDGARSRHARDHRLRDEPHVRPASVVPVGAAQPATRRYRDYYVWRDAPPKKQAATVFPGEEDSVWELDERTGQYYLHSFYRHQPDLNIANPAVRDEIAKTIGYWLELGISGFRVDAVPFLIEPPEGVDIGDPHEFLRDIRRFLQRRSSDAVLLGEVNLPYEQQLDYFGRTGDQAELTMQFDFIGMQALYLSLAREDARPLAESLAEASAARARGAVGELRAQPRRAHARQAERRPSARRCSTRSRPRSGCASTDAGSCGACRRCSTATPAASAWSTACCSRCRAPPCSSTARRSAWARTPRRRAGRPVRTPMQWTNEPNGGFSRALEAPAAAPGRPTDGYAPEHVNVEAQMHDPDSLLVVHPRARRAVPQLARDRLGRARRAAERQRRRARAPHHGRRRPLRGAAQLRADPDGGDRSTSARSRPTRSCPTCSTSTATTSTSAAASTCSSTPTGSAGSASSNPTTGGSPEARSRAADVAARRVTRVAASARRVRQLARASRSSRTRCPTTAETPSWRIETP